MMSEARIVTGVELATILSVTPETVRKWRRAGVIPAITINRTTIRFDVQEVLATLRDRKASDADEFEREWDSAGSATSGGLR